MSVQDGIRLVREHPDGYFLSTDEFREAIGWDEIGWEAKATISRALFDFTDEEHFFDNWEDDDTVFDWIAAHKGEDPPKDALFISDSMVKSYYDKARLGYVSADFRVDPKTATLGEWKQALIEKLRNLTLSPERIAEIRRECTGENE